MHYWSKLPDELDGLTSAQLRQLADQTDKLIERDQKQLAEQQRQQK